MKWISVNERLPTDDKIYAVWVKNEGRDYLRIVEPGKWGIPNYIGECKCVKERLCSLAPLCNCITRIDKCWHERQPKNVIYKKITHWLDMDLKNATDEDLKFPQELR